MVMLRRPPLAVARTTWTWGPLAVSRSSSARAELRWRKCEANAPATTMAATIRAMMPPRRRRVCAVRSGMMFGSLAAYFVLEALVEHIKTGRCLAQQNIGDGHQEEGGESGEDKPADYRTAQRRILLARFTKSQGHGDHAQNHSEGRHQDWTEPCATCLDHRVQRRKTLARPYVVGEAHHQDRVRHRNPHGH